MNQKTQYRDKAGAIIQARIIMDRRSPESDFTLQEIEDRKGDALYTILKDKESSFRVLVYRYSDEAYRLCLIEKEIWNRYTYPFRNISNRDIATLLREDARIFKPYKAISFDEAATDEARRYIESFLDCEGEASASTPEAYKHYALYEFLRTEDYKHLKEIADRYRALFPNDPWSNEIEKYVISEYMKGALSVTQTTRYTDIMDYTGVPGDILIQYNKSK